MGIEDKVISGPEFTTIIPQCSLGEYLIPKMKSQPRDNIIQTDSEAGVSHTTWELLKISLGIAEGLLNHGLEENDVVALVSKNRSELYAAALGVVWIGGAAAPIDPTMKVYELKHMFGLICPKYVFTENEAVENVEKALNLLGIDAQIILFDPNKDYETICTTLEKLTVRNIDVETYKPRPIKSPSTQIALIMPSSGTTGLPKGVGLTHTNIIFQLKTWEFKPKPYLQMPCLQLSHFFWISGILALILSVATGMKRIFLKNINDENVLKAIHKYKPLWGIIAPSAVTALMNHPDFKRYDLSSIKLIASGGSPVTKYLVDRVKEEWGREINVLQVYGMTELAGVVTEADPETNILSVGKLGPGIKLKVVDLETKKSLGPNQVGELYLKSNGIMKGYVGNPEATKDVIDHDGWYHTGDLGYYDDAEYLYIVDRIKEMIKVQNMQVAPGEVESLIETLPGVLEAGVVGIPNEKDMYHPMALVVKRNGSNITEDDIIRFVKENLSEFKHLKGGVKFVHSIPRTPTGKIKRTLLKELAKELYYKN